MKTTTFGAVAASILIGSSVVLAPAANAAPTSTVIAVDQSGVVIAQDQTAQLQAVPSAPRANQVSILARFNHSTNEHLKSNYCIGARAPVDNETPHWVPVDYVYLRMKGETP